MYACRNVLFVRMRVRVPVRVRALWMLRVCFLFARVCVPVAVRVLSVRFRFACFMCACCACGFRASMAIGRSSAWCMCVWKKQDRRIEGSKDRGTGSERGREREREREREGERGIERELR